MARIVRSTYPVEFSIGLLLLIFVLSSFLATQLFTVTWHQILDGNSALAGIFMVGAAVVIMVLILWEDFLFPAKIVPQADVVVFRNHRTKLKTQAVIYLAIPLIFAMIYINYEVNQVRFFIWAAVCIISPMVGKLVSGIKNYNDFLKLTNEAIEYKNNQEEDILLVKDVREIKLIKDENNVLHKVQVSMHKHNPVVIDLDEMELETYYHTIEEFISGHYKGLVK